MIGTAQTSPLVMTPKLGSAIWGGDALVKRYGKSGDPAAPLGESWECWDDNTIAGGAFGGETLAAVRAQLGRELTGPADPAQRFPVLTKIIDARAALSVQVHPDDAYAQRVEHQPVGKTECWYILAAEPGAELVLGWTRDTNRAEYERRVADGTLGEILRHVPVAPGEAYYLPAGTLHAIGAGIQLFETQQASDLTYRIFDWNRTGADGKPRELHVEKAADVVDFRATFPGSVIQLTFHDADAGLERTVAIADRRFAVERLRITASGAALATGGRPLAVMAMETPLELGGVALRAWETAVVPADAGRVPITPGAALLVRIDPDLAALRTAALAAGHAAAAFELFAGQFSGASGPA
ncbi:MAG TPA: type I phosphomannose isomerase catalytic subunit [Candidatus Lustribacter sp.]|jgi:mannose-6-phosphate isomerase|nr:type I phosphomannose isomerase catalytic subunit [Candidatus Lustribacter sp.]